MGRSRSQVSNHREPPRASPMPRLIFLLLIAGCAQAPVEVAFTIPDPHLVPEGIAYDPVDEAFYVGSTNLRKIVRVDADGQARDFVGPADKGLWGVLGLCVDPSRRVLWAASSHAGVGMPMQDMDAEGVGSAGIFKYDLTSGALIKRYLLSSDGRSHFLNDLTVTGDGTVYATDSDGAAIYRIDGERDTLELFAAPAQMPWPNGITWSEDGGVLFVALDGRIGRIDPDEGRVRYVELPEGVRAFADGLYFVDQSLVAVWPGAEGHGVTRYHLNAALDRVVEVEPLLPTHPAYHQPTTGAVVGDAIYVIANSQIQLFRAIYTGEADVGLDSLVDPIVLRVDLGG